MKKTTIFCLILIGNINLYAQKQITPQNTMHINPATVKQVTQKKSHVDVKFSNAIISSNSNSNDMSNKKSIKDSTTTGILKPQILQLDSIKK